MVRLQIFFFPFDNFGTSKIALGHNIQGVSFITLLDDNLAVLCVDLFHSIDNNLLIVVIKILEEDGLLDKAMDKGFDVFGFGDAPNGFGFFDVKVSKNFF